VVASRRMAWVKIYGLPLHVWDEEPFKKIGALFGDFVDFDEVTVSRRRIDVARIKIYTDKLGWINEEVMITVMGAVFVLMVVEDGDSSSEKKVEGGGDWEVQSSGESGEEEVVGSVLGVESEEEEASPRKITQEHLGEEDSPMIRSTTDRMGQMEGQKSVFEDVQEIVSVCGKNLHSIPLDGGQVASGGVEVGSLVKGVVSVGQSTINDPYDDVVHARRLDETPQSPGNLSPVFKEAKLVGT